MTQKPISEMSYQEKVEVLAFALSCGMHKNDELKQIEDESYRESIEKLKGNTRGPKSELIAKQSVIRHVFPEQLFPKWKSFDVFQDTNTHLYGHLYVLDTSTGIVAYRFFEHDQDSLLLQTDAETGRWEPPTTDMKYMTKEEFQQLINAAL